MISVRATLRLCAQLIVLATTASAASPLQDRLEPHIYDFAQILSPSDWLTLEQTVRELHAGTDLEFVVVVFDKKTDEGEAALLDVERRWKLATGKTILFASYLDSVMILRRSPDLERYFGGDLAERIIRERMVDFYANDQVVQGLRSGLYAADTAVTGREHPVLKVALPSPSSPVAQPIPLRPAPALPVELPLYAKIPFVSDEDRARLVVEPLWRKIYLVPSLAILSLSTAMPPIGAALFLIFFALAQRFRWLLVLCIPLAATAWWLYLR